MKSSDKPLTGIHGIDLLEIIVIFQRYRVLMLTIVLLVLALTALGIALMPNVYQARVRLSPPLPSDVEQLNVFDVEFRTAENKENTTPVHSFYQIDEEEIYNKFIRFLQSSQLRYRFFEERNLFQELKSDDETIADKRTVFEEKFSSLIQLDDLRSLHQNPLEAVTVTLEGRNEDLIVEWLNAYVNYVDGYTVRTIVNGISKKAQLQEHAITKQIQSLYALQASRNRDAVQRYREAISIAEAIGLVDQACIPFSSGGKNEKKMGVSLVPGNDLMYLRGSRALQAELNVLQHRKDEDPFIPELPALQQRLAFLAQVKIAVSSIHAVQQDQLAYADGRPVRPKRILLGVLGFCLGCLLAVFAALLANWRQTVIASRENIVQGPGT